MIATVDVTIRFGSRSWLALCDASRAELAARLLSARGPQRRGVPRPRRPHQQATKAADPPGEPKELAPVFVLLASDEASYISDAMIR
ncbi:hypothetical protein [Catellatospora vulcania]|uniref:hypothetical protein n=1 Tax=Catellatospora vulcania TaxID=1460450 RepID=UPI001E337794|nr:hypothetical protein [Catellatospora vulcania]